MTNGGTTAETDDYTIGGSTSITISPGSKTGATTMVFTPNNDSYNEGDTNETVVLRGSSEGLMVGTETITIVDDDFDIVLELDNSMVSEDADDAVELELTARLTGGTRSTDLIVPVALATDTDLMADYTITINDADDADDDNITIKAGDETGTARVTVTVTTQGNDEVYSGDMMVNLVANHATLKDKLVTITLVEDEAKPTITLSANPTTLREGESDMVEISQITAKLSGAHAGTVTVILSFGGTATKGDDKDYVEPINKMIMLTDVTADSTEVDFGLVNDGAFENPETIIVSGSSGAAGLDVSPVTLTVNDDDYDVSLVLGAVTGDNVFEPGAQMIREDIEDAGSVTVRATLNSARTTPLTIALSFSGDGASSRYSAIGGTTMITVAPGQSGATGDATVTIDPVNNELRGGEKTIMVSGTATGINVSSATESITIVDDEDAPTVAIKVEPDRLNEDAGAASVVVTAELTGGDPLADAATIELTIDPDGDAADVGTTDNPVLANENDFTVSGTKSITIPAGARSGSRTLTVNVVDDPLFEQEEMIMVSATTDAPVANNVPPNTDDDPPGIADKTITIVDNDFDIKLSVDTSSIAEDASGESAGNGDPVKVKVTATQTGSRSTPIVIIVSFAEVGTTQLLVADGTDGQAMITIDAGKMSGEVEVSINPKDINNAGYEGERKLEISGAADGGYKYNIQGTSIAIADDEEKPTVTLSVVPATVMESTGLTSVTVTATLKPNGLSAETTITLELSGTAVRSEKVDSVEKPDGYGDRDYSAAITDIIIAGDQTSSADDGGTNGSVMVSPNDDDEFEPTKTIIVSGKSDNVASVSSETIMLLSDDFDVALAIGTVSDNRFIAAMDNVHPVGEAVENPGAAVVQAMLQSARTTPLTIVLSFSGPGAASSYSTIGGTTSITVAPGPSGATGRTTITIDPVNNMLRGGNKDINVTGTSAGINIMNPSEKITIIDDEAPPTVTITPEPARLNEDAGAVPVVVTAKLSNGDPLESAATITLKADAADVGASNPDEAPRQANKDDFSVSGRLEITIPAGMEEGSTTLTVNVVDDPLFERDETITVTASTDAPVANNVDPDGDGSDPAPGIAEKTITIVDNDYDVKLTVSPDTVDEDAENPEEITVTATLPGTRTTDVSITVMYYLGDETQMQWNGAMGDDRATVTIKAGDMSGSTKVMIDPSVEDGNDELYGGDRKVAVNGLSTELKVQNAEITIADDEVMPTVKLTLFNGANAITFINEAPDNGTGNNTVNVTVTATLEPNGLASNLTDDNGADIALSLGGTAVRIEMDNEGFDSRDYSAPTIMSVDVDGTNTSYNGSVNIVTNNDDMFEGTKTIVISGKNDNFASIESASLDLINDDYDVLVSIPPDVDSDGTEHNPAIVPEDSDDPVSVVVRAELTAARTSPVTVQLTFGGTEVSRYTVGGTTTITLGAGVTTGDATVNITPHDNELRGGDKMIEVGGTATGINVQPASRPITLRDDEPEAALTLTADPSSVSEGAGATPVTITAELNVGMEKAATIELSIINPDDQEDPAKGDGEDYSTSEMMSISLPRGSTSASSSFTLTPNDDNLHENPDETIVISGSGGGVSDTATITLLGNDYDVRLSADPDEVTEGDDATDIVITAELAGGTRSNPLTVNIGIGPDGANTNRYDDNTGMIDNLGMHTPDDQPAGAVNSVIIPAGSDNGYGNHQDHSSPR